MKKTVFIVMLFMSFICINGYGQKNKENIKLKADTVSTDSLNYKLIILDPGFDSWLATKPPENFYSQAYYESRNRLYVSEWNQRYLTSHGSLLYDTYIDYNYSTDYGLDLNYKLYYYFRFFEATNHIRLVNTFR